MALFCGSKWKYFYDCAMLVLMKVQVHISKFLLSQKFPRTTSIKPTLWRSDVSIVVSQDLRNGPGHLQDCSGSGCRSVWFCGLTGSSMFLCTSFRFLVAWRLWDEEEQQEVSGCSSTCSQRSPRLHLKDF